MRRFILMKSCRTET